MARTKKTNKRYSVELVTNVDKVALKNYLKQVNKHSCDLSQEMGYDKSYLSGYFSNKFSMPKTSYRLMCMLLKVDEDKFLIKEVAPKPIPEPVKAQEDNHQDIVTALNQIAQAITTQTIMITKICEELKRFNEPTNCKTTNFSQGSKPVDVAIHQQTPPAFVKKL